MCTGVIDFFEDIENILADFFRQFTAYENLDIFFNITAIILTAAGLLWGIYHSGKQKPGHKTRGLSSFNNVSERELLENIFADHPLEKHIERISEIPTEQLILIHGHEGTGKTREALEMICKQNKILAAAPDEKNIYYSPHTVEVPQFLYQKNSQQNVVVFIDDLRTGRRIKPDEDETDKRLDSVTKRLNDTISFFRDECTLSKVIVTMTTKEFEKLRDEASGSPSKILKEFKVIELKELSQAEKVCFVGSLADKAGLQVNDGLAEGFASACGENLRRLAYFIRRKSDENKKTLEEADLKEFKKEYEMYWEQEISKMSDSQKLILDILSSIAQFSLSSHSWFVTELAALKKPGSSFINKRRIKKALTGLKRNYVTEENGIIYCQNNMLSLRDSDDSSLKYELQKLYPLIKRLAYKRRYRKVIYGLLLPFTRVLHDYSLYRESLGLNSRILRLPGKSFPAGIENAKSTVMFYNGRNYYSLGREHWNEAERCYRKAIDLCENNLYARHSLAILCIRKHKYPDALGELDYIVDTDPDDIVSHKTKLEALMKSGADPAEAFRTFRIIKRLANNESISFNSVLQAELTCTRFSQYYGRKLKDAGETLKADRRFGKTGKYYETLITKTPPEENQLEAIIRNSYACFLHDILDKMDDAAGQLEKACEAWPEHTFSLHKLALVYLDEAEIRSGKRKHFHNEAEKLLQKAIKLDPRQYACRLSIARLEGEQADWYRIDENSFWDNVSKVYSKYMEALEPENENFPSIHNAKAHHVAGCFLWHVEVMAYKRKIHKSVQLPSADMEFEKSLGVEKYFDEPPPVVSEHLLLAYHTLGSYYITTADGSDQRFEKGRKCLKKSLSIYKSSDSSFRLVTQNSYAQSYIGKLLLGMHENEKARAELEGAVKSCESNWRAWWLLGRVHELDGEYEEALNCFEMSAEGQQLPSLFGQLRHIAKDWIGRNRIPEDRYSPVKYSGKAYELDRTGRLDTRNITDYGYDLYLEGKKTNNENALESAYRILMNAYEKNLSEGLKKKANFPLWYAGECMEALNRNPGALRCYIESALLSQHSKIHTRLHKKLDRMACHEQAAQYMLELLDRYPCSKTLLRFIITHCCIPVWDQGRTINDAAMEMIIAYAENHPECIPAAETAGIALQRNRDNERALPYLQKAKGSGNGYVLRSLFECLCRLGRKKDAQQIFTQLYSSCTNNIKRNKLEKRAKYWGLECHS